jgi:hypothetical protein
MSKWTDKVKCDYCQNVYTRKNLTEHNKAKHPGKKESFSSVKCPDLRAIFTPPPSKKAKCDSTPSCTDDDIEKEAVPSMEMFNSLEKKLMIS